MMRLTSAQVCKLARITYRQLDNWTNTGILPLYKPGTGHQRLFTIPEAFRVVVVAELVSAQVLPTRAGEIVQTADLAESEVFYHHGQVLVQVALDPLRTRMEKELAADGV